MSFPNEVIDQETALRNRAELQMLRAQFRGDFLCNALTMLRVYTQPDRLPDGDFKALVEAMADFY
ncbi:hypothetical protein BH09VER1_BH09VER1_14160 [soil metagenome]